MHELSSWTLLIIIIIIIIRIRIRIIIIIIIRIIIIITITITIINVFIKNSVRKQTCNSLHDNKMNKGNKY